MLFYLAKDIMSNSRKKFLLILWTILIIQNVMQVGAYSLKRETGSTLKNGREITTESPLNEPEDVEYEVDNGELELQGILF